MVLLEGGMGGRGNASYKTSTNRAPRQHQPGMPARKCRSGCGSSCSPTSGLVGLPNAGKSTFINPVSNAQAKVGDYPFTTLIPQLGVVRHKGREFVFADIPGLIEGAAEVPGSATVSLAISSAAVLLHLIDVSADDPLGMGSFAASSRPTAPGSSTSRGSSRSTRRT